MKFYGGGQMTFCAQAKVTNIENCFFVISTTYLFLLYNLN